MAHTSDDETDRGPGASEGHRRLRLGPGVALVALLWVLRFVVPAVAPEEYAPEAMMAGVGGALLLGLAVLAWWVFFSRAPRGERWGAPLCMVVALLVTALVVDESIATGMMGLLLVVYSVPFLALLLVVWAALGHRDGGRRGSGGARWGSMVAMLALPCLAWTVVRTEGLTGAGGSDFAWRWSETAEERLLAMETAPSPLPEDGPVASGEALAEEALPRGWPGFRGPGRDGVLSGSRIGTDWDAAPPTLLWRQPVGPGWSSFAVRGERFYTQEQRGEEEWVACYSLGTGELLWSHADPARFWESNAGAGPRGTPTLDGARVFAFGATGIVNALDAESGTPLWSRDAGTDGGVETPEWGFSSSPLVVDDLLVVAAAGVLIAYDLETGDLRWRGPFADQARGGYSSPQPMTIDGVEQVVLIDDAGALGVRPQDGELLWEYPWGGDPIVQPGRTADGDVLISVSSRSGLRRLTVANAPGGWTVKERWGSIRLKPYFNDYVVHAGHAFGTDGSMLACIDLTDGARAWKGGRYGPSQVLLLADQDALLVLTEEGELALVGANPSEFQELARMPAIEGKTWNHPVLVGDVLLVRNDREMAAFRLPKAES